MMVGEDPEAASVMESPGFEAAGYRLSCLWTRAADPIAVCVVAHGAGAGMIHPFLQGVAQGLAASSLSALRFNFPYMEAKRRIPDGTAVILEVWAAALAQASHQGLGLPIVAAGKSFGGRMASILAAQQGDGFPARGLVFFGYPLHAPGRIDRLRDAHLPQIRRPMLFIQGTRDPFARLDLVKAVIQKLSPWARLHVVEGGDHSFRVPGTRRPDREVGHELAQVAAEFVRDSVVA